MAKIDPSKANELLNLPTSIKNSLKQASSTLLLIK